MAKGYVASLARPGGNVTGIVVQQMELAAKRIELLREVLPDARRIGLVSDALSIDQIDTAAGAARSLGFVPLLVELSGPDPRLRRRAAPHGRRAGGRSSRRVPW